MDIDIAGAMSAFSSFVWSTPTAILLTGAGLLFTFMTVGVQFKALTHGIAVIRGKYDNPDHEGNISHFQALCAALSGTIGLGKGSKSEQVRRIVDRRIGPFSISDIEADCIGVSRDMIRIVLRQLRDDGAITLQGKGRGAKWIRRRD